MGFADARPHRTASCGWGIDTGAGGARAAGAGGVVGLDVERVIVSNGETGARPRSSCSREPRDYRRGEGGRNGVRAAVSKELSARGHRAPTCARTDPVGDLDGLSPFPPGGWCSDPPGRHPDPARTSDWLTRAAPRFDEDGLSNGRYRRSDTGRDSGVAATAPRTRWDPSLPPGRPPGPGLCTSCLGPARAARWNWTDSVPVVGLERPENTPSLGSERPGAHQLRAGRRSLRRAQRVAWGPARD